MKHKNIFKKNFESYFKNIIFGQILPESNFLIEIYINTQMIFIDINNDLQIL